MRGRDLRAARLAAALAACAACAPSTLPPPATDRHAYFAFRARHPGLLEPNYLPFLAHRVPSRDDALVLCRWDDDAMPLAVAIDAPRIPDTLQDEFDPKAPALYTEAARDALATWERELGGLVRFRLAAPEEAVLRIALVGEVAPEPEPDVAVLGATALGGACEIGDALEQAPGAGGAAPDVARFSVRFHVSEVRLYMADRHGLLPPDQVRRNALHEVGHALGMRGHSPVPADLMYEVARDRPGADAPSPQDVNSFVSLYRLPNGTVYGRAPEPGDAVATSQGAAPAGPPPGPPPGPPRLAVAPHVDSRFGYSLRLPDGWMRGETPQGIFAIDGTTWDYDASLQVIARGYDTAEAYLERHAAVHVGRGRVREERRIEIAGRTARRLVVEERLPGLAEEITVVPIGGGRVLVVIADCPAPVHGSYRPWFDAALASLRVDGPPGAEPPALTRERESVKKSRGR